MFTETIKIRIDDEEFPINVEWVSRERADRNDNQRKQQTSWRQSNQSRRREKWNQWKIQLNQITTTDKERWKKFVSNRVESNRIVD